jgi:hypothetical protein
MVERRNMMEKKIYLCPGKNPNHWAYTLKPRKECTRDYEHGVIGGSRGRIYFECNNSHTDLEPTFKNTNKHECDINSPSSAYGAAINVCMEDDAGRLWAGNGEYDSMVKFCPECGFKGK